MVLSLIELPPELLHATCSFLDDQDLRLLRLTCRTIGAVADCHAFQTLMFYLHDGDFEMLRYFANHKVFSKSVTTLVYVTSFLPQRRLSFEEWLGRKSARLAKRGPWTKDGLPSKRPVYTEDATRRIYDKYAALHNRQTQILANGEDFALFKEVLPKFIGLREIVVSARSWFLQSKDRRRTPFDEILLKPSDHLKPTAWRQIGSLMLPMVELGPRIQSLSLGAVFWSFLCQLEDPSRFIQMAEVCRNLTAFNLQIDTMTNEEGMFVPLCKAAVRKGDIRRLIEAMPSLESLYIGFCYIDIGNGIYPAEFKDLVSANTHWQYLSHVSFDGIEASRQDLIDFMSLHSSTLRTIELKDLSLLKSSWRVFLPQLQELAENMFLDDITLTGLGRGESEDDTAEPQGREEFELGHPEDQYECLSNDITAYILWGEGPNPLDSYP